MVKIYTVDSCPYCAKVKRYLKSKDVEFEELDIEKDPAAREACKKLTGIDWAVPVTTIDNEHYVINYDKEADNRQRQVIISSKKIKALSCDKVVRQGT